MPLSMTGRCDACDSKLEIQDGVLGSSPMAITIEDIMTGTKKELIVCSKCWNTRYRKALYEASKITTESYQNETSEQP
jgi:hypothetical protein